MQHLHKWQVNNCKFFFLFSSVKNEKHEKQPLGLQQYIPMRADMLRIQEIGWTSTNFTTLP